MSNWNYRVLYSKEHDENYFSIHEVYYDDEGKPNGYVDRSAFVIADTPELLKEELNRFSVALEKPILDKVKFPEEYNNEKV